MRNRAKCKKCEDVIESYHEQDFVSCKCGEINVYEGDSMKCAAYDWSHFVRIDDLGNEIVPKVLEKKEDISSLKPDRRVLFEMLDEKIKFIEDLPVQAMSTYINHYDFVSVLLLMREILKS